MHTPKNAFGLTLVVVAYSRLNGEVISLSGSYSFGPVKTCRCYAKSPTKSQLVEVDIKALEAE